MPDSGGAAAQRSLPRATERGDRGAVLRRLASVIRRISGMPDYPAYLEHLRRSHPERPIPTEREFYDEFVRRRYEDGPTRCC